MRRHGGHKYKDIRWWGGGERNEGILSCLTGLAALIAYVFLSLVFNKVTSHGELSLKIVAEKGRQIAPTRKIVCCALLCLYS